MNIGTCGHPIDDEWYADSRSSYYVLDKPTGIVSYVTTCKDCWEQNMEAGLITDGPAVDDYVPEETTEVPDYVFDAEGNKIRITEEEEEPEQLPLSSFFDNV